MAKVAISLRLNKESVLDPKTDKFVELTNLLPWSELAENVYQTTFKPYFCNHEVVVSFCDPEEIQELNHTYRNINQPTDVLSFNSIGNLSEDLSKFDDLHEESSEESCESNLGDIIICVAKAQEQAKEKKHSLKDEIAFLFVHGLLHLLGYDHQSPEETREMFNLQDRILESSMNLAGQ